MQEHVHTGFVPFLFAGISAWIFLNLLRIIAIKLDDIEQTKWLAKAIGGTVNFSIA